MVDVVVWIVTVRNHPFLSLVVRYNLPNHPSLLSFLILSNSTCASTFILSRISPSHAVPAPQILIRSWDRELQRCIEYISCDEKPDDVISSLLVILLQSVLTLTGVLADFSAKSDLPFRTFGFQLPISTEWKRTTSLILRQVLKRSCQGNHSSTTKPTSGRVKYFGIRLTGHVVFTGSTSVEGGPKETGTEGIIVRGSPLGVNTTRGPLGFFDVPSCETSSVLQECVASLVLRLSE